MVASGILDAYYEVGVYEWDFAAAGLIARESGAKFLAVPAIPSGSQHFVLVAGPSLYGELGQEMISDGRWIKAI
jgi:myo-inositol-1(or 4)-monophosphatase